jgi:hypothetical protein
VKRRYVSAIMIYLNDASCVRWGVLALKEMQGHEGGRVSSRLWLFGWACASSVHMLCPSFRNTTYRASHHYEPIPLTPDAHHPHNQRCTNVHILSRGDEEQG